MRASCGNNGRKQIILCLPLLPFPKHCKCKLITDTMLIRHVLIKY